jgi:hypothetical protein
VSLSQGTAVVSGVCRGHEYVAMLIGVVWLLLNMGDVSEKGLEGWKGYIECHYQGGVLSRHCRCVCPP